MFVRSNYIKNPYNGYTDAYFVQLGQIENGVNEEAGL